jgi:hypothetical protein
MSQSQATMAMPRSRLPVGTNVHVRFGVADPDYPDLSIDGWEGTVAQIDGDSTAPCLVHWNRSTLENTSPTSHVRSVHDDLVVEEMWLAEDDLLIDP